MMLRRHYKKKEERVKKRFLVKKAIENATLQKADITNVIDYESLKVEELKQLLNEREIEFSSEMKKAELVAVLLEGDQFGFDQ